ncbi:EAL domain-containing protein [Vibrio sp. AK197]
MAIHDISQCTQWLDINSNLQFIANYKQWKLTSVFQPIFDKLDNVIGAEALVRITDLEGQIIQPDHFFHSKTTQEADKQNVERLSQAIHLRNFSLSKFRDLKLFLNLLPTVGEHYATNGLNKDHLYQRLRNLHLRSDQLVMEVVESQAKDERLLQVGMNRLSVYGVNIAIDDFGSEASNQRRVEMLRPHIMKLDRSLLAEYMCGKPFRLLDGLRLAKRVGAQTVIEGIETLDEYDAMHELDIDMFQGYYLGVPEALQSKIFVEAS